MTIRTYRTRVLGAALAGILGFIHTANADPVNSLATPKEHAPIIVASKTNSWAVAFDNDVLVPGSRDQDYTYGVNLTFTGEKAKRHWLSLNQPLTWIDAQLGRTFSGKHTIVSHKTEYGVFGFTPENIRAEEALNTDRPYASLVYVASSREAYDPQAETSWNSTLTLGVLGLSAVGDLQDAVHSVTDSDKPEGWEHQISDGGELTARLSLSKQKLLISTSGGTEVKSTLQASVGYITEASWSVSARFGEIHTPWVSFNPELTSYGEKSAPAANTKLSEHYFWVGLSLKARGYNAFLQGQFRDSEVEYGGGDLNHGIIEAWAGYTLALTNGYRFTYSLRGHSSEIKTGLGDRNVVWGGLQLAKTFG